MVYRDEETSWRETCLSYSPFLLRGRWQSDRRGVPLLKVAGPAVVVRVLAAPIRAELVRQDPRPRIQAQPHLELRQKGAVLPAPLERDT
jgi:hypothetical protein